MSVRLWGTEAQEAGKGRRKKRISDPKRSGYDDRLSGQKQQYREAMEKLVEEAVKEDLASARTRKTPCRKKKNPEDLIYD